MYVHILYYFSIYWSDTSLVFPVWRGKICYYNAKHPYQNVDQVELSTPGHEQYIMLKIDLPIADARSKQHMKIEK